jgi:hypothetical protein
MQPHSVLNQSYLSIYYSLTMYVVCFLAVFQATIVCDLVLLYVLPKREFYKNMKYKYTDTHQQVSFEK